MLGLTEEEAAKLRQDKEAKVQQQQQQASPPPLPPSLPPSLPPPFPLFFFSDPLTNTFHYSSLISLPPALPPSLPLTHPQEEEAALSGVVELAVAEGGLGKPNRRVDQMDVIVEEGGVEGEGEEEEEEEEEGDDNDEDRPRLKEEGEGGEEEGEEEGLTSAHHKINHLLHEVLPLCYHQERSDDFAWQFAPFLRHKRIQKVREGGRKSR